MILQKIDLDFSVCKIENINSIDFTGEFVFLSKTDDEISLVCESRYVPDNAVAVEPDWKALKIAGVLDFNMTGVIAGISNILSQAGISIFVISTYNTDYILVKSYDYDNAVVLLSNAGYVINQT